MIVAIMGSQGSGKSTVLAGLQERGYKTVQRKTSRSILEEWGVSLSEVNNDRQLTVRFQDAILQRKIEDDLEFKDCEEIVFTERTIVDFFVYALVALGKDNEYSDWLNEYYLACKIAQSHYDGVVYIKRGGFDIQHDGVRGTNKHYSRMVDLTMYDYLDEMTSTPYLLHLETTDMVERVDQIENFAKQIQFKKSMS